MVLSDNRARLGFALGLLGLLGVLAFSLTLPMTRMAVAVLDPAFVAFGRMAGAGLIACVVLRATAAPFVARSQIWLLVVTAVGVVLVFPLLSSFAMQTLPSSHGAVIVGIVPFVTAFIASLWFGERHGARFWICAALGTSLVIAFVYRGIDSALIRYVGSFDDLGSGLDSCLDSFNSTVDKQSPRLRTARAQNHVRE